MTGFSGQLLHPEDMAMAVRPGASHEGRVLLSYLVRNANTSIITATVFDVEAYVAAGAFRAIANLAAAA